MFSDGSCDDIAFSPDGTAFIATNGLEVRSWSLSGDRPLGPPIPSLIGNAKVVEPNVPPTKVRLSFTADGKSILQVVEKYSGDSYPIVKAQLWEVSTGQPIGPAIIHKSSLLFPETDGYVMPGGPVLAIGDETKSEVRLINTRTGLPIGDPIRSDGATREHYAQPRQRDPCRHGQ